MKLIVCVEKNNGMMFAGKRVSKDSVVREKILNLVADSKLWMNSYTANQFENTDGINVDDEFIGKISNDDYCFVENIEVPMDKVDEIIIFRWNRKYPADFYFEYSPRDNGYKKIKTENFAGSSHEKITMERYIKNEK